MAVTIANVNDFGGRAIHWREQSGSGPTVLLMNGAGLAAEHWDQVVALLPGRHLVRFDRPGMGGTRWPGTLPTLAEEVRSLTELVRTVGAPAVLVAHSMAAFHAEALARLRPELVAGLVLVDGSVEFPARPPRAVGVRLIRSLQQIARRAPVLHLGSLAHRAGASLQSRRLTLRHQWERRVGELYDDPESVAMGLAESAAYPRQAWDLLALRRDHPMPDLPVLVLTAADQTVERDWPVRQRRLTRLLGGRQLLVEGSDHLMMIDRPEVIADGVRALLPTDSVDG
ncbi:alpha/beta fold hydrolase [Enemella evansiae]|uniref:Poly(3-hydroxyalkanoate) depolymerase n=1 Tax=Enemella evansiae TaxID=2016499 RepID=A0A255FYL7_9ACTN|nr:alpha/beta hydrolase [Enemella evansiae]OYO04511.1 poly(3-hydroxyalkanoate) depolymerase [Enemella evansiae]OYO06027.1 poly(3-hydroxyalkanoate) depolymerase [Enemella evansiae]OYO08745.1 poly(3-hydroxyalkanoate) depolymerase [Enemella evansiae]